MPYYLINTNAQSNGDNEVHVTPKQHSSCSYPEPQNQKHLGSFETCQEAVVMAKISGYARANGCYWCARDCHTS